MRHRYDNWVGGLNGDWLISRQRFFGIPFPVWYPLDDEGEPDYAHPLLPREARAARSTRRPTRRGGYERVPARQARRLRRRPRRDGHLGDVLADPAHRRRLGARPGPVRAGLPDGPVHAGARHHPHLAVLPGGARAPREPRGALVARADLRLRRRPGPQEDEQVQGQRRRADRHPREVRRRRGALAGRDGRPGPGLAVRRDPDEGRPPAGDEGAQRLEVRARPASAPPRRPTVDAVTEPVDRAMLAGLAATVARATDGVRGLRLHHRARGDRAVLLGRSATTTSSWSRSGRTAPAARRPPTRRSPRSRSRCTSSCGCSRRSCPTSPRRSGRGGRRARSTGSPGRPPTSSPSPATPTRPCSTRSPRPWPASAA